MRAVVFVCVLVVVAVFGQEVEQSGFAASSSGSKNEVGTPSRLSETTDSVFTPSDVEEEGRAASSPAEEQSTDKSTQPHFVPLVKSEDESPPLKSADSSTEGPNQDPKSTMVEPVSKSTVQLVEPVRSEAQLESFTPSIATENEDLLVSASPSSDGYNQKASTTESVTVSETSSPAPTAAIGLYEDLKKSVANVEPAKPTVNILDLKFSDELLLEEEANPNISISIGPSSGVSKPTPVQESGPLFVRIPIPTTIADPVPKIGSPIGSQLPFVPTAYNSFGNVPLVDAFAPADPNFSPLLVPLNRLQQGYSANVLPPDSLQQGYSANVLPPDHLEQGYSANVLPPDSLQQGYSANVLPPDHLEQGYSANVLPPDSLQQGYSANVLPPDHLEQGYSANVLPPDHLEQGYSANVLPSDRLQQGYSANVLPPPLTGPELLRALASGYPGTPPMTAQSALSSPDLPLSGQ